VLVVFALFVLGGSLAGQTCPAIPALEGGMGRAFRPGARVHVSLNHDKLRECEMQITWALFNWEWSDANVNNISFDLDHFAIDTRLDVEYHPLIDGVADYNAVAGPDGALSATIGIRSDNTSCAAIGEHFAHELGHGMGLGNCSGYCPNTIMGGSGANVVKGINGPTACDEKAMKVWWNDPSDEDPCEDPNQACSPIVVDVNGDGVELTAAWDGVKFDLSGRGRALQIAWTAPGTDDGWLALDRDGNGAIDSGRELFGDRTPQPPLSERSGYGALAMYDDDRNGVIDRKDAIWPALVIWQDRNHDGVSAAEELLALDAAGIAQFELAYRHSGRRDRNGNLFRYRAKVVGEGESLVGRWTYDVFLLPD
jgi:hypothetical protein